MNINNSEDNMIFVDKKEENVPKNIKKRIESEFDKDWLKDYIKNVNYQLIYSKNNQYII